MKAGCNKSICSLVDNVCQSCIDILNFCCISKGAYIDKDTTTRCYSVYVLGCFVFISSRELLVYITIFAVLSQ